MAGPWEAFQDASAVQLSQNDPTAAPPRATVPSSPRVWGDAEAQHAGLYEKPSGPWDAFKPQPQSAQQPSQPQGGRSPLRITVNKSPVADRFSDVPQVGGDGMQQGLNQRGLELTRGPEVSPAAQMAGEANNLLPAATQGTSPHVSDYGGQLVSTDVHEDDAGNILYRDPQTGQLKPTNNQTQVAIRDPADGVIKVFNRSDATNESHAVGVSRVLAPGLAAGSVTKQASMGAINKVIPRASEIFATAKEPYRAFDAVAPRIPVSADEAKNLVDRVQGALDAAHLPSEVAKQVHDTVALISKKGDTAISQLQYVKRAVGKLFQSPDKNVRDGAAVASKEIGRIIGEVAPRAAADLKKADAIHSTARSVQDLQRRSDIAGLRTGKAGYGGNAVNNLRTQIEKIVEASVNGRQTGFKPNEIQAMREIVDGTRTTNVLRTVGAMAPSKGIMAIGAGITTGGITATIGAAANKLAMILTGKQIERLNELVAKRSPEYSRAVAKAVDRFEKSQIELESKPNTKSFTAFIAASRSLSAGLTRDGIQVTSGDLMKMLAGPPKAAADSEQNQSPNIPRQ